MQQLVPAMMGHWPLLYCPQLPTAPGLQNLPGRGSRGEDRGCILTPCPDLSISVPTALPGAAIAPAATCTHPLHPTQIRYVCHPSPYILLQGCFQMLAAPGEFGFFLGPHSFLASSLPLGCPNEVTERFCKDKSMRQHSPTSFSGLTWWSLKAPSPLHPWEIVRSLPIPPEKGIKSSSSFFM